MDLRAGPTDDHDRRIRLQVLPRAEEDDVALLRPVLALAGERGVVHGREREVAVREPVRPRGAELKDRPPLVPVGDGVLDEAVDRQQVRDLELVRGLLRAAHVVEDRDHHAPPEPRELLDHAAVGRQQLLGILAVDTDAVVHGLLGLATQLRGHVQLPQVLQVLLHVDLDRAVGSLPQGAAKIAHAAVLISPLLDLDVE
eukprot:13194260-Alexandrium_andersonii.AAC.1